MLKSVGSNWGITLVTIASAYILTPFTIHKLGDAGYGTWNLINAITGYLALLALGVPMASVRYFAEHAATGDTKRLNEAVGSCTALYLALGAAALLVGLGLFVFFTTTYRLPAALHADAHGAFLLTIVYVALGFIGLLPQALLQAHDDFAPRNAVRFAMVALRLVLTLVLLARWPTLRVLALIQIAALAFDFSVCTWLALRRYPGVRIRVADFDWGMVRKIFSFSLYVLILTAGARLSFETDSLVIGKFQDVSAIPYFAVANSFILYLIEFVLAIAAVVMPAATRLKAQGRLDALRDVFLKWSKVALSITMVAGLFLMTLGPRFIAWWIDPRYEAPAGQVLQILMVSYFAFLPVRGVALPILMGLGKPGIPTLGFLAAGVLNLGLSILLARPLGLAGVALGTAIPNVLFAALVLVRACRELGTPVTAYLRYVVPRATVGALPVLGVLLWFTFGLDVRSLPGIAAGGIAMAVVFGATWVLFVYRGDPYFDVRGRLAGMIGGRA